MKILLHSKIFLYSLLLFIVIIIINGEINKKTVTTSLHAKWSQTSFLAETSEFIAKDDNSLFWSYIDIINSEINTEQWPSCSYSYICYDLQTLIKCNMTLQLGSQILFFQKVLGSEEEAKNCIAFAVVHDLITCDPQKIEELVRNVSTNSVIPRLYSIDHVFPNSKEKNVVVIVYGELGTKSWQEMHKAAKILARSGQIQYVFRHWSRDVRDDKILLSGYDVELAIKNMEYKAVDDSEVEKATAADDEIEEDIDDYEDINGFNFNILRKLHPNQKEALNQFRLHLLERDELTPLKVWQVQDLSYQASQRIISADLNKTLALMVEISQNFPLLARSISRVSVRPEFRLAVVTNQAMYSSENEIMEGECAMFINGIPVDLEYFDIYNFLDVLKVEEKLADGFFRLGLQVMILILRNYKSFVAEEDKPAYALDFRSASPEYLNNLDTDKHYRQWGNSVKLMLQPYFPGMIRPIARNFFTLIFIIDLSQTQNLHFLNMAYNFYKHEIPIRLGFIFVVNTDKSISGFDDPSVAMLNLYNFIKTDGGILKAITSLIKILTKSEENSEKKNLLTSNDVLSFFQERYPDQDLNDIFGLDTDYDSGRSSGKKFLLDSGLKDVPKVLLNGIVLDDSGIGPLRLEETVTNEIMKETSRIQRAIAKGKLTDDDNVMNWILNQPHIMPRINKRILDAPLHMPRYLTIPDHGPCPSKIISDYHHLPLAKHIKCMMGRIRYLSRSDEDVVHPLTLWIVADLEDTDGRRLVYNAMKHVRSCHVTRIAIFSNPKEIESATHSGSISMLVNAAMRVLPPNQKKLFVTKIVKEEFASKLIDGAMSLEDIAVNQLLSDELVAGAKFVQKVFGLKSGDRGIITNGLLIGPLDDNEDFELNDFDLLEKFIVNRGAQLEKTEFADDKSKLSDTITGIMALTGANSMKKKRQILLNASDSNGVIKFPAQHDTMGILDIVCFIDPLSKAAQRLSSLIFVLQEVVNADLTLILNPKAKLSELPLKRFYRVVLEPTVVFDSSGGISSSAYQARFSSLPNKQLLTLSLIPPDSWIVEVVSAMYDLDNIRMEQVTKHVIAEFELEHILLEGHCFDEISGAAPRGLQFTLGTSSNPTLYDTIVMANLGYFQLKGNPGVWSLRLRAGKSKDIYDIASHYNTESEDENGLNIVIDSFSGRTVRVRVTKKEDKKDENLLMEGKAGDEESEPSIWNTISSSITGGERYDAINIFSLASGHLYERFMRIMILSVMKNTKYPVKFWLLKNYLSPNFKEVLPIMAKIYGFDYELVEYKWPKWLHRQTEKHRIMWGFKILFLDVLFPLDLKKIIFVDADQVVRTDLMDLMEYDLGGAPYGFTPFCDSRTTMDGFRFWKKGYWANHLAGRKYHISALFVIDLIKFRQIAAGDRLRGQYQGLSSDPNSLANLDQDLPNNMIHQVRIKSLPQEWLWCETWCDDASKSKAKTIDLCNNPQTKEPKLDSAMRIIPEWKDYDTEIKNLLLRIKTEDFEPQISDLDTHEEL
ncbi:unnamed protein product [Dracunculus medinensis]|uniref:Glyco_transf_24 domain-containing protein n=1 Tax=Dracunculus medinensis TaxID=318479 RepID=A0A0N4UDJ8_DRAME|nr:unnamed protein product [Dracunculus medinensis]